MSKTETGKIENAKTGRVLRDDELDAVNGGVNNANAIDALINTAGRNQQAAHVWLDIVVWG